MWKIHTKYCCSEVNVHSHTIVNNVDIVRFARIASPITNISLVCDVTPRLTVTLLHNTVVRVGHVAGGGHRQGSRVSFTGIHYVTAAIEWRHVACCCALAVHDSIDADEQWFVTREGKLFFLAATDSLFVCCWNKVNYMIIKQFELITPH